MIRIAQVEDDVNFQHALTDALKSAPDMALAWVAATRLQGLLALEGEPVDVLLVDLGLPDGSGIDIIHAAHSRWPECNIMVSTVFGDELHVMQSLEAGAAGYLLKDSAPHGLVAEIRSLHAGGSPISPLIARQILLRFRRRDPPPPPSASKPLQPAPGGVKPQVALSAREQQVLELITKGFTSHEIAALLLISRHTVQTFIRRIYRKLAVNSKGEAVFEARHQGLLGD